MTLKTIRKNSIKAITAALSECVVITCYKYDDMDTNTDKPAVTAEKVMELAGRFDSVSGQYNESGALIKINVRIHGNHFYTGYRTVEDAKNFLTERAFSKYFPEIAAAEQAEQQARFEAEAAIEKAANLARIATMSTDSKQPEIILDQVIFAKFASLNKNSNIGQYIRECNKPEFAERIWDRNRWVMRKNWYISKVKITKIINMSSCDYDYFILNLMESRNDLFEDCSGGEASDFDCGRADKEIYKMSVAELEKWKEQSYGLVVLIQAPGRASFVVNTHGYNYARYVGLTPIFLN